jgi:hypothetical protein
VGGDLIGGCGGLDQRDRELAEPVVGHSEDHRIAHGRVGGERRLDLFGMTLNPPRMITFLMRPVM